MKRTLTTSLMIAAALALSACDSDDDDDSLGDVIVDATDAGGTDGDGTDAGATDGDGTDAGATDGDGTDAGATDGDGTDGGNTASFQVTFNNLSGQLMTPPVVAIHDASINLFVVGEDASNEVQAIAEMGDNAPLVAFATDPANAAVVSAAGVAGDGPFGPGVENAVTTTLSTDQADHVFSAVNMVICTNDGIAGFDSISLPTDTNPLTLVAMVYDAGTRQNQPDSETFFPPPCRTGDVVEAPLEDPRQPISGHPGQTGLVVPTDGPAAGLNFDLAPSQQLLEVTITRN